MEVEWDPEQRGGRLLLENVASQRITAWAFYVEEVDRTATVNRSLYLHDVVFGAAPWFDGTAQDRRIAPGEHLELPVPADFGEPERRLVNLREVRVQVAAVVFEDTRFAGDAELAGRIFTERAAALDRHRRELAAAKEAERERLVGLVDLLERQLPSAFLAPASATGLRVRRVPVGPDRLKVGNCELTASKSTLTENGCLLMGDADITVTESWVHTCQFPYDGHGQTDRLIGYGSCLLGKECWPIFEAPIESYAMSESKLKWSRKVTDQAATAPFGRCFALEIKTIQKECPCPESQANECPALRQGHGPGNENADICSDDEDGNTTVCELDCSSPILIDLSGDGLALTGLSDPVLFDIDGDGAPEQLGWTAAGSEDAFLALDRDGNGRIDDGRELFGNFTPQPESSEPNGFLALAVFDLDGNGWIDGSDPVFADLLLWRDRNHDGRSQPEELFPLADSPVRGISTRFHETRREDRHGNWFRWSSLVAFERGRKLAATDVIFVKAE